MKIYNLVTVHHPDVVKVRVFLDVEEAVEAGSTISPDTDGSIIPNPPEDVWERFGGVLSDKYVRGFFWLRNRVAGIFEEDVHPCGCPEGVVTSALGNMAEQCGSCGSTWDGENKLTALRVGTLNEQFAELAVAAIGESDTADGTCNATHPVTGSACVVSAHGSDRKHWDGSITTWADAENSEEDLTTFTPVVEADLAEALATLDREGGFTKLSYQEQAAFILKRLT